MKFLVKSINTKDNSYTNMEVYDMLVYYQHSICNLSKYPVLIYFCVCVRFEM